ncbi:MAG: hypothetical protein ABIM22_04390 [candidate division WOR-3 bacterium]
MKIKDIKVIGAIGLMLNLLGIIPRLGFVARITGLILILVALKEISNVLGEQDIFKKYLAGFFNKPDRKPRFISVILHLRCRNLSHFYTANGWHF